MNYKLNLVILLILFSAVCYNVLMAYEAMERVDVQERFRYIGLLETPEIFPIPQRKPAYEAQMAAKQ